MKTLTELTADIVTAQASKMNMTGQDISDALKKAFAALTALKAAEEGCAEMPEAVSESGADETAVSGELTQLRNSPLRSIRKNSVVCLECGAEFKVLGRHLSKDHELTPRQYKKKWGIKATQPLSSKALSQMRRETAVRLGLADKLAEARGKRKKK